MTRQAMLIFAGIPAVLAILGLSTESPGSFAFGFWIGLLATTTLMALGWLRSILFESKHLDQSAAFWLAQEAKIRPRAFVFCLLVACTGILGLAVAKTSSSASLAGLFLAPTFVSASSVLVLWGKVP
jgi:hypothetical protein